MSDRSASGVERLGELETVRVEKEFELKQII